MPRASLSHPSAMLTNMCSVCREFEERRRAAGTLTDPIGPVAQSGRAPPWHGGGRRFESGQVHPKHDGYMFGGLVAGEGSFYVAAAHPPTRQDGSARLRFWFGITMAERDRALLEALHLLLGVGSIELRASRNGRWLPTCRFSVSSRLAHRQVTVPFFDKHLLPSAKRLQFDAWRESFEAYEIQHPTRIGFGPSTCSVEGCDRAVRGRGLCRSHYYRATGY